MFNESGCLPGKCFWYESRITARFHADELAVKVHWHPMPLDGVLQT